ncbi:hypothetical protein CW368_04195 [Actinomycetales bacterium SN12]|nr:hypothetical protein CW368_04195 [Actinomycetales bacterium SN12]
MLELLWPAAVLVVLYAALGGSLAWLIGLRGLWAVAAAPAFATTVIGGASVVAGWLGLGWSVLLCIAEAIVIGVVVFIIRRHGLRAVTSPQPSASRWWTIGAAVGAAIIITAQTAAVIGAPEAISQTFDNVFHLNAIRYILDTGAASPLKLGHMTSPNGGVPFYPSVWHATAGIVVQFTGASIPAVVNAQTIVISALVWPVGAMLLARVLGGGTAITVSAAIVSASVPMFPLLPMDYGVLYPFQLALATVPLALAATASALGIGSGARDLAPGWWILVIAGALPGVALAHPGGFVAWLALSVPLVAVFAVRLWRTRRGVGSRLLLAIAVAAYLGTGVLLLKVLRPPLPTRLWPTALTPGQAAVEVVQVSMFYGTVAIGLAASVVLGVAWAVRRRTAGAIIALAFWAVGALLFVVVIASPFGALRDALTGSWYNNWPRLAALFGVALVPLTALGLGSSAAAIGEWWARRRLGGGQARSLVAGLAAALGFVVLPLPAMPAAVQQAHGRFLLDASSALVSADEMALLQRLPGHVPKDAVIAGNPYTGTALAYAIGGRRVLMPHILVDVSDDAAIVNDHLADAATMPDVCEAADDLDVHFVLDFGEREVHNGSHPLPGLEDLAASGAVRLVDSEGDARLYEVTACGLG